MGFMIVMAKLGTFEGTHAIGAPWDDLVVIEVSLPFYFLAVSAGRNTEALTEAHKVVQARGEPDQ